MVIGDVMLDHYIWGEVSRISPEAPVPVVHVNTESMQPGGAANVYNNIKSLGGQAELCGVIGCDESGEGLLRALGFSKRKQPGLILDGTRPTTRKTRILAHSQQVVRYDIEKAHDVSQSITRKILKHVESRLSSISCLIISDYAKGLVTAPLMAQLERLTRNTRIPILVDPKVGHIPFYSGVTLITPNHLEAQQALGRSGHDDQTIHDIGHQLRKKLNCNAVLITRGEQGMSLCESSGSSKHIPAVARQVFDVTGAGDTVMSTLALALSAGASLQESAMLANYAAGVVVGLVGTASITHAQLREALAHAC